MKISVSYNNKNFALYSIIFFTILDLMSSIPVVTNYNKNSTDKNSIIFDPIFKKNITISFENNRQYGNGLCDIELNCFLPYGICLNSTTCMCMPDYADVQKNVSTIKNKFCSYRKKNVVVAGILELFLPFGLGHFYSEHLLLGSLKLLFNTLVYIFGYIVQCKTNPEEEKYFDLMFICLLLSCLIPLWNIVDLFLFFTGGYRDGNGIEMT